MTSLRKWLQSRFITSSLVFSVISFGVSLFHYVFNVLVARGLSVSQYGEFLTALSYVSVLTVPFLALSTMIIRQVGRRSSVDQPDYIASLFRWFLDELERSWWLIGLLSLSFLIVVLQLKLLAPLSLVFLVVMVAIIIFQLIGYAVLQAQKRFWQHGLILLLVAVGKIGLGLAVVLAWPTIWLIYGVFALANLVGCYWLWLQVKPEASTHIRFGFDAPRFHLQKKSFLVPMLTTFGVIGMANLDLMLARILLSSDQAGWYAALNLLAKTLFFGLAPVIAVAYSFFTGHDSRDYTASILSLLLIGFGFAGFGALAFFVLWPELVIQIFFGAKYLQLAPILWWSAVYGTLYSLVMLLAHFFMARKSWWGVFGLGGLGVQVLLVMLFGSNVETILQLTVTSLVGLCVVYGIGVLMTFFGQARTDDTLGAVQ